MEENTYLNVDEAAKFLRISKSTLYKYTHLRKIHFRKHGNKLIFEKQELIKWSLGNRVAPQTNYRHSNQYDIIKQKNVDQKTDVSSLKIERNRRPLSNGKE